MLCEGLSVNEIASCLAMTVLLMLFGGAGRVRLEKFFVMQASSLLVRYVETTMTLALTIAGWTLFAIAILIGLALNLIGLFGNWVILGSIAAVWAVTGFQHFSWWVMLLLLALASLGELLELLAASYGAARYGGGRGAAIASLAGCIVGAIVGTPWFPLVGTLAGAIVGAFAGALLYEFGVSGKSAEDSFRTGVGAALGRVGGVVAKLTVGFAMLLMALLAY